MGEWVSGCGDFGKMKMRNGEMANKYGDKWVRREEKAVEPTDGRDPSDGCVNEWVGMGLGVEGGREDVWMSWERIAIAIWLSAVRI